MSAIKSEDNTVLFPLFFFFFRVLHDYTGSLLLSMYCVVFSVRFNRVSAVAIRVIFLIHVRPNTNCFSAGVWCIHTYR
jgi:hypothetical protein